jgi:lipopolysaccharide biosynthesis regulator YciM
MDFDLSWLLLSLPLGFAVGWAASRFDLRQMRQERRDAPRAYFKGLNLLLNEQQDRAIDAFIEAVQNDPDTAELHFALGNLFRRRGEFERAVRVHEHLLARPDLKAEDRDRARHALAQDFMRAGLFDRAEQAFRQLAGTAFDAESRLALLSLYERSRDWGAAIEVAQGLQRDGRGSFGARIAHYACEQALQAQARGAEDEVTEALRRAREADPRSARAWVMTGEQCLRQGDRPGAVSAWQTLAEVQPASLGLVAEAYAQAAVESGQAEAARTPLQSLYERSPSMALLRGLLVLDGGTAASPQRLAAHLRAAPSMSAAEALLALPDGQWGPEGLQALRQAVSRAAGPLKRYRCAACGFEAQHYFWQCPGCLGWDSYPPQPVEEL